MTGGCNGTCTRDIPPTVSPGQNKIRPDEGILWCVTCDKLIKTDNIPWCPCCHCRCRVRARACVRRKKYEEVFVRY